MIADSKLGVMQISFRISYLAYFNESHKSLAAVVRFARSTLATVAFLNFGSWFMTHDRPHQPPASVACSVFEPPASLPYSRHPHNTTFFWQTTTPHHKESQAIFPEASAVSVPEVCKLDASLVVDRSAALDKLVMQGWKFEELYWPGNKNHFLTEANHAFNANLLQFMSLRAHPP